VGSGLGEKPLQPGEPNPAQQRRLAQVDVHHQKLVAGERHPDIVDQFQLAPSFRSPPMWH
jgi:hypothetical protein